METKNINNLLAFILELVESGDINLNSGQAKAELLNKAKLLPDLIRKAKEEGKNINDNQQDELILNFGEKFYNKLRV